MTQDRKDQRSRTLKTGRILLESGGVIDCVIRDISEEGARIRIGATTPLPKRFRLQVVADGSITAAELKWQRGAEAGVGFVGTPAPPTT